MPYGPTAYFGVFNTVLRHDIGAKKEVGTIRWVRLGGRGGCECAQGRPRPWDVACRRCHWPTGGWVLRHDVGASKEVGTIRWVA